MAKQEMKKVLLHITKKQWNEVDKLYKQLKAEDKKQKSAIYLSAFSVGLEQIKREQEGVS